MKVTLKERARKFLNNTVDAITTLVVGLFFLGILVVITVKEKLTDENYLER